MIKFSLIVPFHISKSFDRRQMLDGLVMSLPDREDLEIILVDDRSEVEYRPPLSFQKSRIRIIENRPGRKYAGTARNTGMEMSTGDFLLFADSDDCFSTPALNKILDYISSDPDTDLVISRTRAFMEDGSEGGRHIYMDRLIEEYSKTKSLVPIMRLHTPLSKFIRRDFLVKNKIEYGGSRVANDVLFAVKLGASAPRIRIREEVVYRLREGNKSLTNEESCDAARTRIRVAREAQDFLLRSGMKDLRHPLGHSLLRYCRRYPAMCLQELLTSIWRGDRIFSSKRRALARLIRFA